MAKSVRVQAVAQARHTTKALRIAAMAISTESA
jgi:hypothetical protein